MQCFPPDIDQCIEGDENFQLCANITSPPPEFPVVSCAEYSSGATDQYAVVCYEEESGDCRQPGDESQCTNNGWEVAGNASTQKENFAGLSKREKIGCILS